MNHFFLHRLLFILLALAIGFPHGQLLAGNKPVPPARFKQLFDSARGLLPDNAIKAEPIALQLHRLCLENGHDSMIAKSSYLLGTINYYLSRYYQSVDFYDRALKSTHAKNSESFAEYCWNNQGVNYEILNQLPAALQAYQQSLRLAEKRGDSTSMGQSWINIGLLDSKVRHFKEATAITKRALGLFTRNADTLNMALCFQNLASFNSDQQQFAAADSLSRIALNLYRAINNRFGEAELVMSLGSIAAARNNIGLSNQYLQQAVAITSEMEMGALLGAAYQQLGDNEVVQARYQSAADFYTRAMARFEQAGAVEKFEAWYLAMANLYAKTSDFVQYSKVMDKYRKFKEAHDDKLAMARYDELKNLYQFEKNTQQILQQGKEIRDKRRQLYQLGACIALLLAALATISWFYIRSRNLTRSLYDNNIARLNTSQHAIETTGEAIQEKRPHAALFNRIVSLMEEKRWFTQPNLSLSDLSIELGTNEKYISQAINTYSKTNFNVFVNRYRVDEAKRLMISSGDDLSIKQVAGSCGFSNNTTFYRQFKEITGLTPSTFLAMSAANSQKAE